MSFTREGFLWDTQDNTAGTAFNTGFTTSLRGRVHTYLQWSDNSTSAAGTAFDYSTADQTIITGNHFSDVTWSGINFSDGLSEAGKFKNALMEIFKKVPKELIKTKEDKRLVKAKEKSEKLLKEWLSPDEYRGLTEKGEITIPDAEDEEIIFIVKKDPNKMVQVKKKGEYQHQLCLVAEDLDYPVGDQLLSKLMMLKTDQKKFKELAIKHS